MKGEVGSDINQVTEEDSFQSLNRSIAKAAVIA